MTTHHKVGEMHHYGKIVADALKYDNSGHTVTLYEMSDDDGYVVVEWDKDGYTPLITENYESDELAIFDYIYRTFGVSV